MYDCIKNMIMNRIVCLMFALAAVISCRQPENARPALDISNMDLSVDPGEDFYRYATGGWMDSHPLTPEYARYGTFNELIDNNEKQIRQLFGNLSESNPVPGSEAQKINDLYSMGLDSARLSSEGAAPLKKGLDEIAAISDSRSLAEVVARMHSVTEFPFFAGYVSADMVNSDANVLYISQSGLGMGDRDYYLDTANAGIKDAYRQYLARIIGLAGMENPDTVAAEVLEVEDAIAEISWSAVELRDVKKSYNPISAKDLKAAYPAFDFGAWFRELGIEEPDKIIVGQPSYLKGLDSLFTAFSQEQLKKYLAAQHISEFCTVLGEDFYDAYFDFFSRTMAGAKEKKPRWKRSLDVASSLLPEAVGKLYVEAYFPQSSKDAMLAMVSNIRTALAEHIDSLKWMSDSTKTFAKEKLDAIVVKVGYPDTWKDYSSLIINPTLTYMENVRNIRAWNMADNFSRLQKPVDKTEWLMSPQTVNAYYNPATNEICFPAAILQPPFFNPEADDAVNYGAIGVVISHEMTHGFDDQGRHFDKNGNMTDWWKPEDEEAFRKMTDVLVAQFDLVTVLPGLKANGALCLGENIADQGGLRVAYTALQNSFGGERPADIDGFTAEQRFYLSYANIWAMNITDQEKARLTRLDVHSLGENRVNVTLRNLQTFFDAFGIEAGDAMYRPEEERVIIW